MSSPTFAERLSRLSPDQRRALDELLEQERSNPADTSRVPPSTGTERALTRVWAEVLGIGEPGVTDDFFSLGGDSISAMQVAARATAAGVRVTPKDVLEAGTIAVLATLDGSGGVVVSGAEPEDDPIGAVELTPIQRWFFEQGFPDAHQWDQTLYVTVRRELVPDLLRAALLDVTEHHHALRSRFHTGADGWRHTVPAESPEPVLEVIQAPDTATGPGRSARIREAVRAAQSHIDVGTGPLVAAVLVGGTEPLLILIVHHLVVDGISMRVLVEDLDQAYRQRERTEPVRLPERTTSFRTWAHRLGEWASGERARAQLPYWHGVPDAAATRVPLGPGGDDADTTAANTVGRCGTRAIRIGPETTERLLRAVPARGTSPLHLLLAALLLAWPRVGQNGLQLDMEAHGREPAVGRADVSRTVGWFTSIFPVRLDPLPEPSLESALAVVTRVLDALPDNGVGYGILRYLGEDGGEGLDRLPQSQVSLNYLGRFERGSDPDEVLGSPVQAPGVLQSGEAPRRYLLDVVVAAVDRELLIELVFARDVLEEERVQALADDFAGRIEALVDHVVGPSRTAAGTAGNPMVAIRRQMGLDTSGADPSDGSTPAEGGRR